MAAVAYLPVLHIALPGIELARALPRRNETITSFLRRTGWNTTTLPTICLVDGEPVLRANWNSRRIRKGSAVEFLSRPRGGGLTQNSIAGLVGVIALSAFAPWAGGALFGAGTVAAKVAAGAIMVGGGFLINTLMAVKPGGSQAEPDPIYSWGTGLNLARPLEPIPSCYGRRKRVLDKAAPEWSSYEGNDQYIHVLLSRGEGRLQPEQILIEDTPLWTSGTGVNPQFSGVQIAFYNPGQQVTLFPVNVESSAEVSGQELDFPAWTGGFIANAAGTQATRLVVDLSMPNGCGLQNDAGVLTPHFVPVMMQYRPVDAAGNELGDWTSVGPFPNVPLCSKSPLRFSLAAEVPAGRYKVRVRRTTPRATDTNIVDQINWAEMRAFLTGPQSFPVSTIAIRAKATDQFSGDALSRLSEVATRILPVWNGSAWVEQPTRSPAWAALDIVTNTSYGGSLPLSRLDFQAFVDLAATCAARGDTFDHDFAATVPVPQALDTALSACRAKHVWMAGTLSLVREQWSSVPRMLITDQEIVRGSLEIEYLLRPTDEAQCAVLEYLDESTWQLAEAVAPRSASEVQIARATRLQLPIVKRAQAQREVEFLLRQNLYRRINVRLTTEHDGRLLYLGAPVLLQSDLPQQWGASGKVTRRVGNALYLHEAPAWVAGQHYILIRDKRGRPFGPIKCARGANDGIAILDGADLAIVEAAQGTLNAALERPEGAELPSFAIGLGTTWQRRCIVTRAAPAGDRVSLELFVDDARAHDEDLTEPPPLPEATTPRNPTFPQPLLLSARFIANEVPCRIVAEWGPVPGAVFYVARVSYDEGESWTPLPDVRMPKLSAQVEPLALRLGVAAVNASGKQGPWAYYDLEQPTTRADNVQIDVDNMRRGIRDLVTRTNQAAIDELEAKMGQLALLVASLDSAVFEDQQKQFRELQSVTGRVTAAYREEITVATGPTSALAQAITELRAAVDNFEANLSVKWVAAASPIAGAMSAFELSVTAADGLQTAQGDVQIAAFADGAGGAYSVFAITADRLLVRRRDNGQVVGLLTITSQGIFLNGDLIAAGTITAEMLNVAELSSIIANLGTVVAGRLRSQNGKYDHVLGEYEDWIS
ncbi:MAG: hypothetical protein K0S00_4059 [Xanthobacteraceae bacterium]|jgi:hypothetical protein|nr:hypothetical protein [Xanthobacteraceae bacterium]